MHLRDHADTEKAPVLFRVFVFSWLRLAQEDARRPTCRDYRRRIRRLRVRLKPDTTYQDPTCLPDTASDSLVRPASIQTLTSEQGERIRSNVSSALPKS